MIEISYANVMNGINKGIHMRCLCPTRQVADNLFRNACELWYIEDFATASRHSLALVYGIDKIQIQFQVFESIHNSSWRGFRGVFMIHPDITPETIMPRFQEMINEMNWHNERHLEKWQA